MGSVRGNVLGGIKGAGRSEVELELRVQLAGDFEVARVAEYG